MSNLNQVVVAGNTGKAAEVKTSKDGSQFVTFSVALNRKVNGTKVTDWVDCLWSGDRALAAAASLTKGKPVVVVGRWQNRQWTDKNGAKRQSTELIVSHVTSYGLNFTVQVGNLVEDAELAYTPSGTPYLKGRLAVNTGRDDRKRVDFWPFVLFGNRTENLVGYLTKGEHIAVTGEMRSSEWVDDAGAKHYRVEIFASDVNFVAVPKKDEGEEDLAEEAGIFEEEILEEEDFIEE